jgi:hypothetical protein
MHLKSFSLCPGDLRLSPLLFGMPVVMCPVIMLLGGWRGGGGRFKVRGGGGSAGEGEKGGEKKQI